MVMTGDWTSIPLRRQTVQRLKNAGRKGETYDFLINKLLEYAEIDNHFEKIKEDVKK